MVFITPGLGFPVVFIIGKFQCPVSWKLPNECTRGFGREPLVSKAMCIKTMVNETHQLHPKICWLSFALPSDFAPDEDYCSSLHQSTGGGNCKSYQSLQCSGVKCAQLITAKFRTYHKSVTVVACATGLFNHPNMLGIKPLKNCIEFRPAPIQLPYGALIRT